MNKSTKSRTFILWSQQPELNSSLEAHLIDSGWQIKHLTGIDVLLPYCAPDSTNLVCLCLLDSTKYKFSPEILRQINKFHEAGNSLIVASSCYGSSDDPTNTNRLTSRFGIKFNRDCVIRPNPYEQYHPKEARLSDFIANKGLVDSLKKFMRLESGDQSENKNRDDDVRSELPTDGPHILYTNGCTLSVNYPSTIMMTSSEWVLPGNQAICAFYRFESRGRLIAIGSSSMFNESYIDKEDNRALLNVLLDFVIDEKFVINISDAKTVEIPEVVATPDINQLADVPIPCLQVTELSSVRQDIARLIDERLFSIDSSLLPSVIRAYQEFGLIHEPLTLIKPTFRVEPLELKLATHNFIIRRNLT